MAKREVGLFSRLRGLHWPFVALVIVLGLVGYGTLYSAAGGSHEPWAWRHGARLAVGVALMLAIGIVDLRLIYRLAYPAYFFTVALLVVVDIMGEINKGAQRWIDLGFMQLQPSELMKLCLILALARFFHGIRLESVRRPLLLLVPLTMILTPAALVLVQPDLGTAVMLLAGGTAVLWLAGVPRWQFTAVGALGAVALPAVWSQLHDYQRQRVWTFLDPTTDPLGAGYHIIQSKIALGSGGLWGKGFLEGTQAQLDFLPEKQTDFAFTMLAEEAGFIGALIVLLLFFMLLMLTMLISLRCASQFGRLLAMGLGCNVALYVIINVAMVAGLLPVVGIPLPLVSYGGTAMVTVLMSFGLILSADRDRERQLTPGERYL